MSPELLAKQAYDPASADIFAAGAILFILYAGYPAFGKASISDGWYKLVAEGNFDFFWQCHDRQKKSIPGYFSKLFKHLVSGMIAYNPADRFNLATVLNHDWFKDKPTATLEEA